MDHLDPQTAHQLNAGALTPAEAARWEAHLAACERCRALLERERAWSGLMRLGDPASALPEEPLSTPAVPLPTRTRRQGLSQAILAAVWILGACVGAAGVGWQWAHLAAESRAALPRLTAEERRAAAHQVELSVLLDDAWVATDLETLVELDRLLRSKK